MNLHKLNLTFSFELIVTSEEKLITLPTQREGLEYLDQILNSSLENIEDYEVCNYLDGMHLWEYGVNVPLDLVLKSGLFRKSSKETLSVPTNYLNAYFFKGFKVSEKKVYPMYIFNIKEFLAHWEELGFPTKITSSYRIPHEIHG